jgi:hypothetical protein
MSNLLYSIGVWTKSPTFKNESRTDKNEKIRLRDRKNTLVLQNNLRSWMSVSHNYEARHRSGVCWVFVSAVSKMSSDFAQLKLEDYCIRIFRMYNRIYDSH